MLADESQGLTSEVEQIIPSSPFRYLYLIGGFIAVGFGTVGLIVPGLPGTVFFIIAAWCFSHSSPRFEKWVLDRPVVGAMVSDYRAGLGMPKRAKITAITAMSLAVTLSAGFTIANPVVRVIVLAAGVIGVWYVGWHVPTKPPEATEPSADPR